VTNSMGGRVGRGFLSMLIRVEIKSYDCGLFDARG